MNKSHSQLYASAMNCAVVLFVVSIVLYAFDKNTFLGHTLVTCLLTLSLGVKRYSKFKGFSFGILILGVVTMAMFFPQHFLKIRDYELKNLITPLLQLIMFGMGSAMSIKDFGAIIRNPKAVYIGLACQFSIMPLLGAGLAIIFQFPAEVAAGIILIGSSPSGLASNVMAYIGKANLALSVTLTTIATLCAPIITPILMKTLGDQLVPIDFWSMMWGIIKITILPIAAGLLFNKLAFGKKTWFDKAMPILSMAGIAVILIIITANGRENLLTMGTTLIVVSLIHNLCGYLFGYWGCRLFSLDKKSCRTIAFEVGMQNAGLATGISLIMGKVGTVGLAAAVFGPIMNITGSSLASWWRDSPVEEDKQSLFNSPK